MQPEQLGPFHLGRILGRGGMGVVYEGVHEQTGESAAVKVLLSTLEDDEEIRLRFEAEINTLKRLRHPNIARLFGFGEEQGLLYYVMEMVDGPSLQQEMKRKRLFQWHEVAKIGLEMCFALKHGHDRGITHRDIKPANILLDHGGTIKLSDYGIAHFFGGERLTEINSVVGTLEYMSPEQSLANPIGPRSDIYSLGTVLYSLLVGKPPFSARNLAEIIRKHQNDPIESIRSSRPDIPDELEGIIFDLLKTRPEDRPHNAYMVAKRFQSLLQALVGPPERILVKPMGADFSAMAPPGKMHASRPGQESEREIIDLGEILPGDKTRTQHKPVKMALDAPPVDDTPPEDRNVHKEHEERGEDGLPLPSDGTTSIAESFGMPGNDLKPTRIQSPDDFSPYASLADSGEIGSMDRSRISNEATYSFELANLNENAPLKSPLPDIINDGPKPGAITRKWGKKGDESATVSRPLTESGRHEQSIGPDDAAENDARPANSAQDAPTVGGLEQSPNVSDQISDFSGVSRSPSTAFGHAQEPNRAPRDESSTADARETGVTRHPAASRFVAVEDVDYEEFDAPETLHRPVISVQTILASTCLVLIGIVFWYMLQPVPPDVLFDRIKNKIESGMESRSSEETESFSDGDIPPGALKKAESDIRYFIRHYANHPKIDLVRFYEEQLDLADLERRLERRRATTLGVAERAYMEALSTVKSDPEKTMLKLQALIDLFGTEAPADASRNVGRETETSTVTGQGRHRLSNPTEQCVEIARRRLKRLQNDAETIFADQATLLGRRLDDADAIEKEHPERAAAVRQAIIELYDGKLWARKIVDRARSSRNPGVKSAAEDSERETGASDARSDR